MSQEAIATVAVFGAGLGFSWGVWVSKSIFSHSQSIALMKQQLKLFEKVEQVLVKINDKIGDDGELRSSKSKRHAKHDAE